MEKDKKQRYITVAVASTIIAILYLYFIFPFLSMVCVSTATHVGDSAHFFPLIVADVKAYVATSLLSGFWHLPNGFFAPDTWLGWGILIVVSILILCSMIKSSKALPHTPLDAQPAHAKANIHGDARFLRTAAEIGSIKGVQLVKASDLLKGDNNEQ